MPSFTYSKIPMSIQETPFSYITSLDDYLTMQHIMDVVVKEKITNEYLLGIFNNIRRVFSRSISDLERCVKTGKTIDQDKLARLVKTGNNDLILVSNEHYMSFASYPENFENSDDNIVFSSPSSVLYNVGMLENTGSISVVPSNANVFLSSLLYSYALMNNVRLYSRMNQDILHNIAKIYYNIIMNAFGRKSGLIVSEREKKEHLFLLTCCLVYGMYCPRNKVMGNLKDFISYCSSAEGNMYLSSFLHKLVNTRLVKSSEPFNPENYDNLLKFANCAREMELLETGESEMKIQWFKMMGSYGVMALENYPRFVAYICATVIPNAYISSVVRVYNKAAYEYLMTYFVKELYNGIN